MSLFSDLKAADSSAYFRKAWPCHEPVWSFNATSTHVRGIYLCRLQIAVLDFGVPVFVPKCCPVTASQKPTLLDVPHMVQRRLLDVFLSDSNSVFLAGPALCRCVHQNTLMINVCVRRVHFVSSYSSSFSFTNQTFADDYWGRWLLTSSHCALSLTLKS